MSDTTTPAEYRNQAAPWPKSQDEVTAESLCKALAARAYAIDLGQMLFAAEHLALDEADRKARWREFGVAATRKNADAAICAMLRAYGEQADAMALAVWQLSEFGEADEFLHDWLTEWGIDPARLLPAKASA